MFYHHLQYMPPMGYDDFGKENPQFLLDYTY